MPVPAKSTLGFVRLPEVAADKILTHMSDPRVAKHMPLLTGKWDRVAVAKLVTAKKDCWRRDGLGHWAILNDGAYVAGGRICAGGS